MSEWLFPNGMIADQPVIDVPQVKVDGTIWYQQLRGKPVKATTMIGVLQECFDEAADELAKEREGQDGNGM